MAENFLAGQASIWVQPDGPNTEPIYLGCHGIGDVDEPMGDKTLLYCPDPAAAGAYKVKNSFRGAPGAVTATIDTDLRTVADYLESLGVCGVPIYVHKFLTGRRDTFSNFDRTFIFYPAEITSRALSGLASRTPDDEGESGQSFEISSEELIRGFNLQATRISLLETQDITGVAVGGEERCETSSSQAQKVEDYVFAASKHRTSSATDKAVVLASIRGLPFAETAADPFAGGEDIQGIVAFRVGRDTIRILVARGTTAPAAPGKVAYSDDLGATWTDATFGSTNGEFVVSHHALCALDRYHIWLGTNLGKIYFSSDGGVTWTLQESGAISATNIVAVKFYDTDIGFALYTGGDVAKTVNGSATNAAWSAATDVGGTGYKDLAVVTPYFLWAVGTSGKYYSHDAGVTWALRDATPTAAIDFYSSLISVAAGSAASGPIHESVNGGYDWNALPTITNAGFTDVLLISPKLGYVSGVTSGGTGFLAMLQPKV